MATLPRPTISLEQPQPLDPVRYLSAVQNILGQRQEFAIRQQQQNDLQATTAAMKSWDGKDYDALAKSVLDNGGSAAAATGIQQHGLTIKKTVSDIAAQDAATGAKNLDTFIGKHKAIGDALQGIEQVPDEQLHDAALGKISDLTKAGIFDPQKAQALAQQVQGVQDPKQLRSLLEITAKEHEGAQYVATQAKTAAETAKDTAQGNEATASAAAKQAEATWYQQHPGVGAPGVPAENVSAADWLAKNPGKTFSDYTTEMKKVVAKENFALQNAGVAGSPGKPSVMAQEVAAGRMKWNEVISPRTPQTVKEAFAREVKSLNPDFDTSTYGIETKAAEKATSGQWADTRLAYNTALDHSDLLLKAADALDNHDFRALNSVANKFKTEFGWSGQINYDAIANVYNHEVTSVVSKGHITDKEVEGGHATLPDNANAQTIHDVVNSYKSLMTSKRDELDKIIKAGAGNKANAVMGTGSNSGGYTPPANAPSATGPNGHKIVVDGGKWVDAVTGKPI